MEYYQITPDKITVVYPGVDDSLHRVELTDMIRAKYVLPERYLYFMGTLQPRKNIDRLIKAFDFWRKNSENQDVFLVLGGKTGWLFESAWTEGIQNIRIPGYVDDADVAALYSGAIGFVFPSLYEGFGFPILEAMRCGTPVLCANTSSLPELAGDAAIPVDPLNVESIAEGIRRLVEDEKLRQELIKRGKQQAQKFTWDAAAKNALAVLEVAVSGG